MFIKKCEKTFKKKSKKLLKINKKSLKLFLTIFINK